MARMVELLLLRLLARGARLPKVWELRSSLGERPILLVVVAAVLVVSMAREEIHRALLVALATMEAAALAV